MTFSKLLLPVAGTLLVLAAWLIPVTTTGANIVDAPTAAALQELQAQQLLISANQVKIDAQLAIITEDLRVARLYVARSGGKKK